MEVTFVTVKLTYLDGVTKKETDSQERVVIQSKDGSDFRVKSEDGLRIYDFIESLISRKYLVILYPKCVKLIMA